MNITNYTQISQRKILTFINKSDLCNLATYDINSRTIDIVPMYYVFFKENCQLNFYLLSSSKGNTINNIKNNNISSIAILMPYSKGEYNYFISIAARGTSSIINDNCTIVKVLKIFLDKYGYSNSLLENYNNKNYELIKMSTISLTSRIY